MGGVSLWDVHAHVLPARYVDPARRVDDHGATVVRGRPDRFGPLASSALPDAGTPTHVRELLDRTWAGWRARTRTDAQRIVAR